MSDIISTPRRIPGLGLFRSLIRRPLAAISLIVLTLVFGASIFAPVLAPFDPNEADFLAAMEAPSKLHPLGTDALGRDILSRLLHSGIALLGFVAIASAVSAVVGIPAGLIAGLRGGRLDALIGRISDLVQAVPGIMVFLTVLAVFQQNMNAAMVALGVLAAPGLMRVVRAATLAVRSETYVTAARVSGLTDMQIALRHILPRIMGPVAVNLSLLAATALLATTGLNFIGLGVRPPDPTWGSMIAEAASVMAESYHMLISTGSVLVIAVLAFVLLGDALRDHTAEAWGGVGANHKSNAPLPAPKGAPRQDAATGALVEVANMSIGLPSPGAPTGWMRLVDDVSFTINPGECVGLVGESGCGKSLTGLGLLGLLPSSLRHMDGQIWYEGRNLTDVSASERASLRGNSIAFISQEPMVALDPLFTVGSQLSELIGVHEPKLSRRARKERALELLKRVQIRNADEVLDRYPGQLSGGMAQRVCIALALSGRPKLIVADEPTTALDVTVQAEIVRLLKELQQDTGLALLLITHDWSVVSAICDRAIVMYAGHIVETASTTDLIAEPRHPYAQGLLASNPHLTEPGQPIPAIAGTVPPPTEWPDHCRFAARCTQVQDICKAGAIELRPCGTDHAARCVQIPEAPE